MLPLSLVFPLCLGQVKWHCKPCVNTFPVLINVLSSGAFQKLQYSLENSTRSTLCSSQYFSCSNPSEMISWLRSCHLCLHSGVKPANAPNMLSWTWDLCSPVVTHQREPFLKVLLVQWHKGTEAAELTAPPVWLLSLRALLRILGLPSCVAAASAKV